MNAAELVTMTEVNDLQAADNGSWYTIAGAGGDLAEWTQGLTDLLVEQGVGAPVSFHTTTGANVNHYAERKHGGVHPKDLFKADLVFLLFPLDGLDVGRLALIKLEAGDRWFDDVVANMAATTR